MAIFIFQSFGCKWIDYLGNSCHCSTQRKDSHPVKSYTASHSFAWIITLLTTVNCTSILIWIDLLHVTQFKTTGSPEDKTWKDIGVLCSSVTWQILIYFLCDSFLGYTGQRWLKTYITFYSAAAFDSFSSFSRYQTIADLVAHRDLILVHLNTVLYVVPDLTKKVVWKEYFDSLCIWMGMGRKCLYVPREWDS